MQLIKTNILLTGPPGSGKTRLIQNIVEDLRKLGATVGGLLTPEVRVGGERIGFHVLDIQTGEKEVMADVRLDSEIKVGRYGVNVNVIRDLAVNSIVRAMSKCDLIVIDEIGKMELYSTEFQEAVEEALSSPKPLIGTVGERLRHPFTSRIKELPSVNLMTLTRSNWDQVYSEVKRMILRKEQA
jgi:nucleoside-triphosphatase